MVPAIDTRPPFAAEHAADPGWPKELDTEQRMQKKICATLDRRQTRAHCEGGFPLFRERGFEKVSVAEVMKAADLTHGAFYAHFGSKEKLQPAAFPIAQKC